MKVYWVNIAPLSLFVSLFHALICYVGHFCMNLWWLQFKMHRSGVGPYHGTSIEYLDYIAASAYTLITVCLLMGTTMHSGYFNTIHPDPPQAIVATYNKDIYLYTTYAHCRKLCTKQFSHVRGEHSIFKASDCWIMVVTSNDNYRELDQGGLLPLDCCLYCFHCKKSSGCWECCLLSLCLLYRHDLR